MDTSTWFGGTRRVVLTGLLALLVVTAGCTNLGGGVNETETEPTAEPVEPTPTSEPAEPTPTPEPAEPTPTPAPTADQGTEPGNGSTGDGETLDTGALFVLGALAVVVVGLVGAGVLRGRRTPPVADAGTTAPLTDAERVVSVLHDNNGRVFEDVLQEELAWSPAHTRRVVSGLVATGDLELEETDQGTLVTFAEE